MTYDSTAGADRRRARGGRPGSRSPRPVAARIEASPGPARNAALISLVDIKQVIFLLTALGARTSMAVKSGAAPASPAAHARRGGRQPGPHYKWIALSNTTLGVLMATINQSIVLIALPDIFRGIGV